MFIRHTKVALVAGPVKDLLEAYGGDFDDMRDKRGEQAALAISTAFLGACAASTIAAIVLLFCA